MSLVIGAAADVPWWNPFRGAQSGVYPPPLNGGIIKWALVVLLSSHLGFKSWWDQLVDLDPPSGWIIKFSSMVLPTRSRKLTFHRWLYH
jgi:hypothetical protein